MSRTLSRSLIRPRYLPRMTQHDRLQPAEDGSDDPNKESTDWAYWYDSKAGQGARV